MAKSSVMVLLHNLKQLLPQANNLPDMEDQLQWLYSKFEFMLRFLMYSEERSYKHDALRKLVHDIRDLAHEAEDVVDTYVSDVAKHKTNSTETFAPDINHTAKLLTLREHIGDAINRINEVYKKRFMYGLRCKKPVEMSKQPRRGWMVEEDDIIGLRKEFETLVDRLIGEPLELEIISIVGKGGTGKTTLAKKIYNHVSVRNYFKFHGWVLISNKYRLRNLLLSILSNFMVITEDIHDMDEWELKRQLLKELRDRTYLIVIDDVHNIKAWDELKGAFPKSKKGSRILLTTRFDNVAASASGYYLYNLGNKIIYWDHHSRIRSYCCFQLGFLEEDDSWELFSKKIFGENSCPLELEVLGRKIVKRCWGHPILIVVVASIIRAIKKTVLEWTNVVKGINWKLDKYSDEQFDILTVCFHEIPQHLKTCFLYLSVFPEGFEISVKQLIQLWIAEGLIQYSVEKTESSMEDIAEGYLEELVSLNLIQVMKRRSDGGPKSCRIHDILRDMCINWSKEENFLEVHTDRDDSTQSKPRRLSILSDCRDYIIWNSNTCNSSHVLRSFSCFSQDIQRVLEKHWESLFKQTPLLKVLNLEEGEVDRLPEAIEELFHLRYLKVKPAKNIRVPKSIFNLWNLETIDLQTTRFPKLPEAIWKMQQLRHLYLDGLSRLPKTKCAEDCLPKLLTLSYISNDSNRGIHISEMAPNLRKLGLYDYQCFSTKEEDVTLKLPYLQSLKFAEECTFVEPIKLPATITKITVKSAYLQPNVIQMFEQLPNLQILKLEQTSFDDDELLFGEGSFNQLQLLKFEDSKFVAWKLEKGAMPNLRRLVISNCPLLTKLPAQLWKVNTLQELELFWTSTTLANNIATDLKENKQIKLVVYPGA